MTRRTVRSVRPIHWASSAHASTMWSTGSANVDPLGNTSTSVFDLANRLIASSSAGELDQPGLRCGESPGQRYQPARICVYECLRRQSSHDCQHRSAGECVDEHLRRRGRRVANIDPLGNVNIASTTLPIGSSPTWIRWGTPQFRLRCRQSLYWLVPLGNLASVYDAASRSPRSSIRSEPYQHGIRCRQPPDQYDHALGNVSTASTMRPADWLQTSIPWKIHKRL